MHLYIYINIYIYIYIYVSIHHLFISIILMLCVYIIYTCVCAAHIINVRRSLYKDISAHTFLIAAKLSVLDAIDVELGPGGLGRVLGGVPTQ